MSFYLSLPRRPSSSGSYKYLPRGRPPDGGQLLHLLHRHGVLRLSLQLQVDIANMVLFAGFRATVKPGLRS